MGRDIKNVANDLKYAYLTVNEGRNGRCYMWYMDESTCVAIDIETLEIHEDDEFFDAQFC